MAHGLNTAPQFVMAKTRTKTDGWPVYHSGGGSNYQFFINQTDAGASGTSYFVGAPTSSVVNLGNNTGSNQSGQPCLLYCFSPIEGYSSMGSYLGNGNADGPFVFTGMRPAFILTKGIDDAEDWYIRDTSRSPSNEVNASLRPNDTGSEYSGRKIDILSNGFKIRDSDGQINQSGKSYLYVAFAEHPFQSSRAR